MLCSSRTRIAVIPMDLLHLLKRLHVQSTDVKGGEEGCEKSCQKVCARRTADSHYGTSPLPDLVGLLRLQDGGEQLMERFDAEPMGIVGKEGPADRVRPWPDLGKKTFKRLPIQRGRIRKCAAEIIAGEKEAAKKIIAGGGEPRSEPYEVVRRSQHTIRIARAQARYHLPYRIESRGKERIKSGGGGERALLARGRENREYSRAVAVSAPVR